jgi:hypothetical protein
LLGPLSNNGGPTQTMALLAGSPALDNGASNGLAGDQRDLLRPVDFPEITNAPGGDGADIGAFELQLPTPSNTFTFGKVNKNRRKGTAKLTIEIEEGPGNLELAKSKKVKADVEPVEADGTAVETLKIKPTAKLKRKLRRKGKARVTAAVTYVPEGGDPNTQTKKVKLKLRKRD